jgi:putative FmdB family regulatory protein
MPTYEYRCTTCEPFDALFALDQVPDTHVCPFCGEQATRRMSAPYFTAASASSRRLLDSTGRTSETPDIVAGSLPVNPHASGTRYTSNPAHLKLPRP